ncbi:MAG: 2-C-methyl-D-erythritol 4-phosphate cytidylyltransferase [Bacteroides sp.]|nr:2-C-methyl-D-erythritol 4-phosphate cytidylyltransferase [Bacteroides sp.]MCM1549977.1 2-C-methyl-D-erythritol 4-phosphate cytidylyltransferase [Clostridium sp.]
MVYGIILAGGKGTRMGADIPKQFLNLTNKPILIWTLDAFINSRLFDRVYLTINKNWSKYTTELLKKYYLPQKLEKVEICINKGSNRTLCLSETVDEIVKANGINSDDIVISHDAVRPFVSYKVLQNCIFQVQENQVAMAAIPCVETMYLSNLNGYLIKSQDRTTCYLGQSPQGCKLQLLYQIFHSCSIKKLMSVTAISQLFINNNINVKISYGEEINYKITTPKDLAFAEFCVANNFFSKDINNV